MTPDELTLGRMPSPLGELLILTDAAGDLWACEYADVEDRLHHFLARRHLRHRLTQGAAPLAAATAIAAYFDGDLAAIDTVSVKLNGTDFQNRAWAALRTIPPGQPLSYAGQAARLGNVRAARAVGSANHDNPVSIVIPCHRLVGASGALTGYAGGLERKRWLLYHESCHANPKPRNR